MKKIAALIDLEVLHEKGDGPPKDFHAALGCYLKDIHKGHAHALICVGNLFHQGQDVAKDPSLAMSWYFKAACQGDNNAKRKFEALRLAESRKERAQQIVKKTMKKIAALIDLESLHEKGDGSPKVFPKALECYLKAVHKGHAYALICVGDLFHQGQDVPRDLSLAMSWYFKAACQGDNNAKRKFVALRLAESRQVSVVANVGLKAVADDQLISTSTDAAGISAAGLGIGALYEDGRRAIEDNSQAVDWYRKGADEGQASAQFNLGRLYERGEGVPQDYTLATTWYRKAANQGYATAQVSIAALYKNGRELPPKEMQAHKTVSATCITVLKVCLGTILKPWSWYRKAADQGYVQAQFTIGVLYKLGQGVPQNYSLAVDWFRKAADQGHVDAQYDIGNMYMYGQGVPKNDAQASVWFKKAVDQGHMASKEHYDKLRLQRQVEEQANNKKKGFLSRLFN
ncbi:hypothetical protein BGX23_006994 [Mortierella sp. AD031]|nr:hypothetical protein BGX23_006994 [Mortierella sp. AD031]